MKRVKIIQDIEITEQGSVGVLLVEREIICFVLTPDPTDEHYHITPGHYPLLRVVSPKFGDTYDIQIEGHTLVRFHWGNIEENTEGCVLTGMYVGKYKNKRAVLQSKVAFAKFMKAMGSDEEAILEVVYC